MITVIVTEKVYVAGWLVENEVYKTDCAGVEIVITIVLS